MNQPRIIAMLVIGLIHLSLATGSWAQLPPESVLPDRRPVAEKAGTALPSESELPASELLPQPRDSTERSKALPPESALPPARDRPEPAEPAEPAETPVEQQVQEDPLALLRLAESPDDRVWLRLVTRGVIGKVRALAFSDDSQRLFAAGDGKEIVVWKRSPEGSLAYERTIRWQVQRGERGRIYALGTAPSLVAAAGYGAMGGLGEIVLFDESGNYIGPLVDREHGHQRRIASLAFSPQRDAPALASQDHAGRILYWRRDPKTGLWKSELIYSDDARAEQLEFWRMLHPVVMLDQDHIVAPLFAGFDERKECQWQLQSLDVRTREARKIALPGKTHRRMVTALAGSRSGTRLASADEYGSLFVWEAGDTLRGFQVPLSQPVTALAFSPDAKYLVVGTAAGKDRPPGVHVLDVSNPAAIRRTLNVTTSDAVLACSVSPDGKSFAYAYAAQVRLRPLGEAVPPPVTVLSSNRRVPSRVAFAADATRYILGYSTEAGEPRNQRWNGAFDTEALQLLSMPQIQATTWHEQQKESAGAWSLRAETTTDEITYRLYQGAQTRAALPLRLKDHGAITATCWIADARGVPAALAVGTSANNGIYLLRLQNEGTCELLRQFRGHSAPLTSLAVSPDLRYLASSSEDGTLGVWKLEGFADESATGNRWGADFAIQNERVVVSRIREDGPLYFRGLRTGDTIRRLLVPRDVQGKVEVETVEQAAAIIDTLAKTSPDQQLAFQANRGRTSLKAFQSFPAWQFVASLFVDQDREWAFWTPAGYYDASFQGHRLFGWQVNRGLEAPPDFFLAAQVRRMLERPQIMARLLRAGSLDEVFRTTKAEPPADWSTTLAHAHRLQPHIEVTKPQPNQLVDEETIGVEATISLPVGEELVPPKIFANGVVALESELVSSEFRNDAWRHSYRWKVPLPSSKQVLIQVVAATGSEVASEASFVVQRRRVSRPERPQLFVITAGVNKYHDSRVPDLAHAVQNATSVAKAFRDGSQRLYETRTVSLLEDALTEPAWTLTMGHFADELKQRARPDDLLVLFLSGHGVQDEQNETYYFVTAKAAFSSLRAQQYSGCLSFEDFAVFSQVPCRKLVILDTCHSGAIEPLRQRNLKTALRAMQDDLVLTLTASEGNQEAVEDRQKQLGRFTARLLEALAGSADREVDGNRDGIVGLVEAVDYVRAKVAEESSRDTVPQFPTAGPADLLPYVDLPLTTTKQ